mgnify:CR=1 FL=1
MQEFKAIMRFCLGIFALAVSSLSAAFSHFFTYFASSGSVRSASENCVEGAHKTEKLAEKAGGYAGRKLKEGYRSHKLKPYRAAAKAEAASMNKFPCGFYAFLLGYLFPCRFQSVSGFLGLFYILCKLRVAALQPGYMPLQPAEIRAGRKEVTDLAGV